MKLRIRLIGLAATLICFEASARDLTISGWPLPKDEASWQTDLIDDPVVGRMACPPLVRLSLKEQLHDHLILRTIKQDSPEQWSFELRNGIFWWSGEEVVATDVEAFLERELASIIDAKGNGLWAVPQWSGRLVDRFRYEIDWASPPKFGPYVVAGIPLTRKNREGDVECAGLYQLSKDKGALVPNPGYKRIQKSLQLNGSTDADVKFRTADSYGGSPWIRLSDESASCTVQLQRPLFTVLYWNTKSGFAADLQLRKNLSLLIPKEALIAYGAGSVGSLVSAPIALGHPGYNTSLTPHTADLQVVANELEKAGYHRPRSDGPRAGRDGGELQIRIKSAASAPNLVEKVITDVFVALGIKVLIDRGERLVGVYDAYLTGLEVNEVTGDLLVALHSRFGHRIASFEQKADPKLDAALEAYTTSLTLEKSDFNLQKQVHKQIFEQEPLTVLLQHSLCITGRRETIAKQLDYRDPDWFRDLVK